MQPFQDGRPPGGDPLAAGWPAGLVLPGVVPVAEPCGVPRRGHTTRRGLPLNALVPANNTHQRQRCRGHQSQRLHPINVPYQPPEDVAAGYVDEL